MNSWRLGLSFEPHPPFQVPDPAISMNGFSPLGPFPEAQRDFFQVQAAHARHCTCRGKHRRARSCRLQRHHSSNRAVHWFWQTEASLKLWTPEIYESFSCPITVIRDVPVDKLDQLRGSRHIRPCLHFDFEVQTVLRELGWGWNFFKSSSKPAELRAQTDSGHQLPVDRIRFCVMCCAERVSWPRHETRNLQAEAEENVGRLLNDSGPNYLHSG